MEEASTVTKQGDGDNTILTRTSPNIIHCENPVPYGDYEDAMSDDYGNNGGVHRNMRKAQRICRNTPEEVGADLNDDKKGWEQPLQNREFSRCNSPETSAHSSKNATTAKTTVDYVRVRNQQVEEEIKNSLEDCEDWQRRHPGERQRHSRCLHAIIPLTSPTYSGTSTRKSTIMEENSKVSFVGDTSDSEGSEPLNKLERFEKAVTQIIQDASNNQELLEGGGVPFCYFKFQDAMRAKWNIIKLERMENLLRGKFVEANPPEWEDFDKEFVKIYGPVNQDSEAFKLLRISFKTQRLQMYIMLIGRESELLRAMLQNGILPSSCSGVADGLQVVRRNLERSLVAAEEANVDLNPYTSRTDFFVLPRPLHPITIYVIRPEEVERLTEFNLGKGMSLFLGYNAAVHDVGCTFRSKVIGDERRKAYFEGVPVKRRVITEWSQRIFHLREGLLEYPLGVEANFYCAQYRKRWALFDEESIFGKYTDEEGVLRLSDVFYPQKLGKDQRVILFHGLLQGMIIPPEDILFRIWNRIKFLLEKKQFIKVTELRQTYETYFHQELHVLNWGFNDIKEFIAYCFELFPEDLSKVTTADEGELESIIKVKVEEKQDFKQDEATSDNKYYRGLLECQLSQEWFSDDEELPDSHVCELPFPNPFEFD